MGSGKIFISYRREDTSGESGRLQDNLGEEFGKGSIFVDIIEALEVGLNFEESIEKALNESKVFLAMIGPKWLTASDSHGNPKILQNGDWIRKEISMALAKNIPVIPVLVNGAEMPRPDTLPDDLKPLTQRWAYVLKNANWRYDVGELIKAVKKIIPSPSLNHESLNKENKIFISHRHSDTESDSLWLKKSLQEVFGKENVFLDSENIRPGKNFAKEIEKFLSVSKVVLVVIGPGWHGVIDEQGVPRIFKSDDWVRREVALALSSNILLIPVLMKGAKDLVGDHLPDDIKPLAGLQSTEITLKRWDYDVGILIKALEEIIPKHQ